MPILTGDAAPTSETVDLRAAVTRFLDLSDRKGVDAFLGSEVGLMAASWSQLGSAVWLVRVSDEGLLKQWFPPDRRKEEGTIRGVRFFRTHDGLTAYVRGGVAAIGRRRGPGSLLRQTAKLMAGGRGEPLERSRGFRELMAYLPANHLALAYVADDEEPPTEDHRPLPWWPGVQRAVVGLYEGKGRIDVAVRAALRQPHRTPKLAPSAVDRLLQLPSTTLLASATTFDLDRWRQAATAPSPAGTWGRYLAFLAGPQQHTADPAPFWTTLKPNVLLVWGQDLRENASTPQVAVMVQCADGRAAMDLAERIGRRIIQLLKATEPANAAQEPMVRRSKHLGVPISSIPLAAFAGESRIPFLKHLRHVEPAWTVWEGWLVFALSREHMEHMLDAQFGLVPTLVTVRDVRALARRPIDRSALSILQPDLASDMLDQWLAAFEAGSVPLLDPSWWKGAAWSAARDPRMPGLEMEAMPQTGGVNVLKVDPRAAAAGRLQPGDRIIGIDGRLLSLSSPAADLATKWAESTAAPGPTLRVRRGSTALEVVIPREQDPAAGPPSRPGPVDAIRELVSLGRALQFASFEVHASDALHYSARLSLRFTQSQVSPSSGER